MTNLQSRTAPVSTEFAEPWDDFDRFFDDLSHRLDAAFGAGLAVPRSLAWSAPGTTGYRPARTDVEDTGSSYRLTAEVPGIPKERLEVKILGSTVEVRSLEESAKETKDGDFLHRERLARGLYRSVVLPEPVVAEKATARLVDGVLELELPKQTPTPAPAEVRVPVR